MCGVGENFSWNVEVKIMRLVGLVTEASDGTEVAEANRRETVTIGVVIIDEHEGKGEDEGENE